MLWNNTFSDISRKCIVPNMIRAGTVFGKMHLLWISENSFFHETKRNGMTTFMEFMLVLLASASNVNGMDVCEWYLIHIVSHNCRLLNPLWNRSTEYTLLHKLQWFTGIMAPSTFRRARHFELESRYQPITDKPSSHDMPCQIGTRFIIFQKP